MVQAYKEMCFDCDLCFSLTEWEFLINADRGFDMEITFSFIILFGEKSFVEIRK